MTALTNAIVSPLAAGAKGVDTAQRLDTATCRALKMHGYDFVYRYIWRVSPSAFDLSAEEIETILGAGLGLGIVQHYAGDGWTPSGDLGARYGSAARAACIALGIPADVTIFCDLEGIADGVLADDVKAYGRAWAFALASTSPRSPGLYVGDRCVLGPIGLYQLPFGCYWRSLNLDDDRIPSVRGFAMRQHGATTADVPPGVQLTTADFDVDTVSGDAQGGFPYVLAPGVLV